MCLRKEKREASQQGEEPKEFLAELGMSGLRLSNPLIRTAVEDAFSGEGSQAAQAVHERKPIRARRMPPATREALASLGLSHEDITLQPRVDFDSVYSDETLGYAPSPEDQLLMQEQGEGEEV